MTSAASPVSKDARLMLLGWLMMLTALASGNAPCAGAPVRSEIWPHTMLTAMPVRKPIITEYETNRVYRPRRAMPAATSTMPTMITSSGIAAGRSSGGTPCNAEPAASAAADVVVITIRRVLELRPPATGPAKLAYRPCTGLTPARTAAAMPSGTRLIAPGSAASMSARRFDRSGRTERSHRPAAPSHPRIACTTYPPRAVAGVPIERSGGAPWQRFHLRPPPQLQGVLRPRRASWAA